MFSPTNVTIIEQLWKAGLLFKNQGKHPAVYWLVGLMVGSLVVWLVFCLLGWLISWLVGCLDGWLVGWFVSSVGGCIFGQLIGWSVCQLIIWLVG